MSQLSRLLRDVEGNGLTFWCPGCEEPHMITIGQPGWDWNGDVDRPTFSPSVLVRSGHHAPNRLHTDSCWCNYEWPADYRGRKFKCYVCHSFVTDGKIEFLTDSTHKLAGLKVPLAEWPVRDDE